MGTIKEDAICQLSFSIFLSANSNKVCPGKFDLKKINSVIDFTKCKVILTL